MCKWNFFCNSIVTWNVSRTYLLYSSFPIWQIQIKIIIFVFQFSIFSLDFPGGKYIWCINDSILKIFSTKWWNGWLFACAAVFVEWCHKRIYTQIDPHKFIDSLPNRRLPRILHIWAIGTNKFDFFCFVSLFWFIFHFKTKENEKKLFEQIELNLLYRKIEFKSKKNREREKERVTLMNVFVN